MESLYLLVPLSVGIVFLFALIFWWSVRNGQYDDMEGPAYRVLMDDDKSEAVPPGEDDRKQGKAVDPAGRDA